MIKPEITAPKNPRFWPLAGVLFYLLAVQNLLAQDTDGVFSDSDYHLGPGDQIKMNVFNQANLSGDYTLDGSGRFSVLLIGSIEARGLTPTALEQLLINKLKPDYLINPRISIQVMNYRPYYIIGEVANPAPYAYVDGMSYLTAVAIAGGYTYRAKKRFVLVIKADDPDKKEIKLNIDVKVSPGDIIRVDERLF